MELEYTLTNDTLFKMMFVKYPHLLKLLVAALLGLDVASISEFTITNPEIQPDLLGDKFCRLDISMVVDGTRVDLEVQVANEGDFPERSLYYWARAFSSALPAGSGYSELPQTIVISILAFRLFECADFHSEYRPLETSRFTPLTDRMCSHYFELPKLPSAVADGDALELWLKLFAAKTEDDLTRIEKLEVPEMNQAVEAYRTVAVTPDFREIERLRSLARHNEAAALRHAREEERASADAEWGAVLADKDARIAELERLLNDLK